ncbi:GTP-binding proten HflX [Ammonifex degensii KC4]|uniref:GTPase HflX n=1 Tax=Ammonifex degensii (strain DSM 10501 / KC4) TaxID=429009 RepID=C9R8T8_AMMDK|nr:GTPase HflX [Ammonifex degensii]ACX52717.1 GTP-binding proten HflX [Ammonifex degensii KC4]
MEKGVICYLAQEEEEEEIEYDLQELKELLRNVDIETVATVVQRRLPDPHYLLGPGKITEVKELVEREKIQAVVFNRELSPRQVQALEDFFGPEVAVWDRTQVILEIFRRRAQSREGKIQVELARLTYLYPRLYGLGGTLSRLGGGVGTRGPGETKLEVLRRALRRRITELRRELEEVRASRDLLRRHRQRSGIPVVSLVGYTNAGKSTLLNALAGEGKEVLAEDRLFATLDPVSRRVILPSGRVFLLTDTVGFIKDLPPKLKEAFKATLEELETADLLLHVIDLTSPYLDEQQRAVESLLEELGLAEKPILKVYNKVDRYTGILPADGVVISALKKINLDQLLHQIEARLFPEEEMELFLPFTSLGKLEKWRERVRVVAEEYGSEGVKVTVRGRPEDLARLRVQVAGQ